MASETQGKEEKLFLVSVKMTALILERKHGSGLSNWEAVGSLSNAIWTLQFKQDYSPELEGSTINSAVMHLLLKELFLRNTLLT